MGLVGMLDIHLERGRLVAGLGHEEESPHGVQVKHWRLERQGREEGQLDQAGQEDEIE